MLKAVAISLVAFSLACSSDGGVGACSAPSKCSADPKPTKDAIAQCTKLTGAACGSQYTAASSCTTSQQVCGADDMTDLTATANAILANCGDQESAYTKCCSANPTACQ